MDVNSLDYLEMIDNHAHWNQEIGEWQLRYTHTTHTHTHTLFLSLRTGKRWSFSFWLSFLSFTPRAVAL